MRISPSMVDVSNRNLRTVAGTPATTAKGGTSLVTTAPEPIAAPMPMVTPGMMMALWPIHTSGPIVTVSSRRQSKISASSGRWKP